MSHFKVLVIGDDVEEQLAPYNENMKVEPYVDTEEFDFDNEMSRAREWAEEYPDETTKALNWDDPAAVFKWYHGEYEDIRQAEDGTWQRWTTYNPDSKWDWWTVGGRYNGSFLIKKDANPDDYVPSTPHWSDLEAAIANRSDSALKRAIDFDTPVREARAEAERMWAKMERFTMGLTPPSKGWKEFSMDFDSIEEAREQWNAHPWNVAAKEALGEKWFAYPYEDFCMGATNPQASYIRQKELFAGAGFYAMLNQGEWTARGDMGGFGMSDDTVELEEWYAKIRDLIASLPDDTRLTTVDCHI